jgi:hypothetical protein
VPLALGILTDILAPNSFWLSPAATSISAFLFWFWAFPVSARGAFAFPLLVGVLFLGTYFFTGLTLFAFFQTSSYFSHRVLIGAMGVGPLACAFLALAVQFVRGRNAGGA